MFVRNPDQVASKAMDVPGASGVSMRLMVGRDDGAPNFSMRQFHVEPGGHTPLHEHNYEHEVLILAGRGRLMHSTDDADDDPIEDGDVVFIAANELHQFRNDGDESLAFMCLVPTSFDCSGQTQSTPGS